MRLFAIAAAGLILLAVAACEPFGLAESASAMLTDKTFTDHVVSWSSGKNCSTIRYNLGQTYCEEDEPNLTPDVYCYRTLGDVTCYDRPDPYDGRHRKIGDNDHNFRVAR